MKKLFMLVVLGQLFILISCDSELEPVDFIDHCLSFRVLSAQRFCQQISILSAFQMVITSVFC